MTKIDIKQRRRHNIYLVIQTIFAIVSVFVICSSQVVLADDSITLQSSENDSSLFHQVKGSFDFGIGLGGADIPDNVSIGWDFLAGSEWLTTGNWRIGAQLHFLNGTWPSDTNFQSLGIYATARPENKWLRWIQLKAGFASDDYSTTVKVITPFFGWQNQSVSWSGAGAAVGIGISVGDGNWSFHILDVERHFVAGHSFNTYTISIAVIAELL